MGLYPEHKSVLLMSVVVSFVLFCLLLQVSLELLFQNHKFSDLDFKRVSNFITVSSLITSDNILVTVPYY